MSSPRKGYFEHIVTQGAEDLKFTWSCVQMQQVGGRNRQSKCTDTNKKRVTLPSFNNTDSKRGDTLPIMKFVPRKLKLRQGTVYMFKVEVRANAGSMGCYNTERKASATVSVEIAKGVQDRRLAPRKVVVCSKYPCTCSGTENDRRRFNLGSKVVLRACTSSTEFMKSHKWEATSPASMAGASFTSRTGSGTSRQQLVTVMINSPISKNVLEP